jgi:Zn-finger nucleic acid-binding protein
MHHSRLCAFVIDCQTEELDGAAAFWGRALGKAVAPVSEKFSTYRGLQVRDDEPMMLLQQVGHPSRVHLDIETDDVEAEVARLEALGAKKVEFVKRWWVMEAPTGHRFCVVKPQRGPLAGKANVNTWGAEDVPVLEGTVEPPAGPAGKTNLCPKCRSEPMKEEVFEGIAIDRCPVCKGIFLDQGELEGLLAKRLADKVDAFAFTATSDVMDNVHGICPRCARPMDAAVGPEGIRVDWCPGCQGMFLEQGELATLQLSRG